jgi:ribonuclease Z
VRWRDRQGEHAQTRRVGELSRLVLDAEVGQRIGYVTDLRDTEDNARALRQLMPGVDRLFIESMFLDRDRAHAARKNHLTATQAGRIARRMGAGSVTPFHFSPRYQRGTAAIVAEVLAAWSGGEQAPACPA